MDCLSTTKMAPKQKHWERDPSDLEKVISAVNKGELSIRKAAERFKIPYETIRTHAKGLRESTLGRPPVMSKECEEELRTALVEMKEMGHRAGVKNLRVLGKDIAAAEEIQCFKSETPSRGRARRFMSRHNLKLRVLENISKARMESEKPEILYEFYKKLEQTYQELVPSGLSSSQIYNTDEAGLCLVNKSGKVIAMKGDKSVRVRKGGERGENITVIATVNASGTVILPPTVIFKGKTLNDDLMKGTMEGVIFAHSKSSFVDTEIFKEWFDRFVVMIPRARPVLLIMDGHAAHISLEIIRKASSLGIHILLFPAHLTHLLQPLDISVFGPLKKAFSHECDKLSRKNKIKALNRYFFPVFNPAYCTTVTPSNIICGFSKAGIWPLNPTNVLQKLTDSAFTWEEPGRSPVTNDAENNNTLLPGDFLDIGLEVSAVANDNDSAVSEECQLTAMNYMSGPRTLAAIQPSQPTTSSPISPDVCPSPDNVESRNISFHERRVLAPVLPPNQIVSSPISPVVAAVREFLKPVEHETTSKVKKVTTARMITSKEFIKALEEKENLKIQTEKEKARRQEERKKKRNGSAKEQKNKTTKKRYQK